MKGVISNFRMARHHQKGTHMIIKPEGVSDKESAMKLAGKTVVWKSPAGREIKGKVAKEHGGKGYIRAIFEKGMPGQSLASEVEIK
jgi:large subunit ribosomal protein L35Ae